MEKENRDRERQREREIEKEDRHREGDRERLGRLLGSETKESSEESCLPCIILSKSPCKYKMQWLCCLSSKRQKCI